MKRTGKTYRLAFYKLCSDERGVTLLDTVVGVALMLVIFLGIAGAFRLSVDVVTNNKARTGAIALANERMEYIRSLPYTSIGTSGGIPSGSIPQSETVTMNGVQYTRRTYVEYGDDPKDGLGGADTNHIPGDYRTAKVDISWTAHGITRHITLTARFESSSGMEVTCSPCGTLNINAVDAASGPLSGATVTIVNSGASPAVNLTTFTDVSGVASLIGAPVAAGYQVTVTKNGLSTAQTYSATSQNTNPNPAHLTVANGQTTTGSFAIDLVAQKTVTTWTQIQTGTWNDTFSDESKISASASTTVSAGVNRLSGSSGSYPSLGTTQSVAIEPTSVARWRSFSAATNTPSQTAITFQFYDGAGGSLIPDSQLPGNSVGFATGTVDLLNVATSTYPSIAIVSTLTTSNPSNTPSVDSYAVTYDYGPLPLANIPFNLTLLKSIGSGPSGTVYKYTQGFNTGTAASVAVPALEWGTYDLNVPTSSGYDVASACQSATEYVSAASTTHFSIAVGANTATNLYLVAHTTNSLIVDVRSSATGTMLPGATVTLTRSGFSATATADQCGQVFFSNLTSSSSYSLTVSASGYTTFNSPTFSISGAKSYHVTL